MVSAHNTLVLDGLFAAEHDISLGEATAYRRGPEHLRRLVRRRLARPGHGDGQPGHPGPGSGGMSKPIEPGCLAMVTRGTNTGMTVHVIDRAPHPHMNRMPNGVYSLGGAGMWIVDMPRPLPVSYDSGLQRNVTMAVTHERSLLRIDGGEDESVTERNDEEVDA